MRVLYLVDDYSGPSWYRCHVPGMELKRLGHDVVLADLSQPIDLERVDVLVLQRLYQPMMPEVVERVRSHGGRTILDIDDDYWNIRPENPAYEAWRDGSRLAGLEQVIRMVDAVTTPSRVLAESLRRLNRYVNVLPNMLPPEHWQLAEKPVWTPDAGRPMVIGWSASASHRCEVPLILDVILQLLEHNPHIEFHVAGLSADAFGGNESIKVLDPVPIEQYPQLIEGFDIGIAPLTDNRFNQAKSDLKLIEYGMVHLPVVASPVGGYPESARHGESVLFAKNAKDWLKYLRALIGDAELRGRLASSLHAVSSRRTIDLAIDRWLRVYVGT